MGKLTLLTKLYTEKTMARPIEFDKQDAINAALALFWEKGFSGTSLTDLLSSMKINKGSFYAAFKGKRALFQLALKQYHLAYIDTLATALCNTANPEKNIRSLFELLFLQSSSNALIKGCFLVNTAYELAISDPELANTSNEYLAPIQNALQANIEKGQELGIFHKHSTSEELSHYLMVIIAGLRVSTKQPQNKATIKSNINIALSTFIKPIQ